MRTNQRFALVGLIIFLMLAACYCNQPIQSFQVGLLRPDGASVSQVLTSGVHTSFDPLADIIIIDVGAKTSQWTDPDLVTRDSQPIGIEITVTYARKRESDNVLAMWNQYPQEARDDAALSNQVLSRLPGVVKDITTQFTLNEMLGINPNGEDNPEMGRTQFTQRIVNQLTPELSEVSVNLLDLRVVNISPDAEYLEALRDRALAQVEQDVARERTQLIQQQLAQEEAQTEIELERARRQNEVNAELARVYDQSPAYLQLEQLRILAATLDETDQIIFIPPNSPLSLMLYSGQGQVVNPQPSVEATPEVGD